MAELAKPKPNVQLATRVKFLEADLVGAVEHKEFTGGTRDMILVKQMNAGDEDIGVSVKDIAESIAVSIKDITGTGGDVPVIDWPTGVDTIVESLKVCIKEVYLKIARVTDTSKKSATDLEYALWIEIKLDKTSKTKLSKTPPFDLIQLEELYLKIWQTDNPVILRDMGIVDFEKLLPGTDSEKSLAAPGSAESTG